MNTDLLRNAIQELSTQDINTLRQFVKYPTERNACYFTGYIAALNNTRYLSDPEHSFLLALSHRIEEDEVVRAAVLEELQP